MVYTGSHPNLGTFTRIPFFASIGWVGEPQLHVFQNQKVRPSIDLRHPGVEHPILWGARLYYRRDYPLFFHRGRRYFQRPSAGAGRGYFQRGPTLEAIERCWPRTFSGDGGGTAEIEMIPPSISPLSGSYAPDTGDDPIIDIISLRCIPGFW